MADRPIDPTTHDGGPPTGAPRWVKVSAAMALIVVVIVVVLMATGGGEHGPGRHSGSDDQGAPSARPDSGEPGGHKPPPGGHAP